MIKINRIIFTVSVLFISLSLIACDSKLSSNNTIQFEIKSDERVIDFCNRLETQISNACEALTNVAATEKYENFIVPPPIRSLNRFEGIFRPGKYNIDESFSEGDSTETMKLILDKLVNKAEKSYSLLAGSRKSEWESRSIKYRELNVTLTPYEVITLASMVEKESVNNRNYSEIAEVFLRRLNRKDRLGSCPTVEYALGYHRPFLLNKDIAIDSPYNVYVRQGLPPTPISFVSDDAIRAVLKPARKGYYFFVFNWAKGELFFSSEYSVHKKIAEQAKSDFIKKYGKENLRKVYPDKFYEY